LICGLYTFIWGWINAIRLNIKNIMLIWTLLIIVSIIRALSAAVNIVWNARFSVSPARQISSVFARLS
jgi:hypothetical protein